MATVVEEILHPGCDVYVEALYVVTLGQEAFHHLLVDQHMIVFLVLLGHYEAYFEGESVILIVGPHCWIAPVDVGLFDTLTVSNPLYLRVPQQEYSGHFMHKLDLVRDKRIPYDYVEGVIIGPHAVHRPQVKRPDKSQLDIVA